MTPLVRFLAPSRSSIWVPFLSYPDVKLAVSIGGAGFWIAWELVSSRAAPVWIITRHQVRYLTTAFPCLIQAVEAVGLKVLPHDLLYGHPFLHATARMANVAATPTRMIAGGSP
jgi:hypothetical protein